MAGAVDRLLALLGPEIEDVEEEAFLLFAQSIPSSNLGFVDPKATELDLTINGQDLTIAQSPAVLASNRAGGTTGAVVWKITPLFASWLAQPGTNIFFQRTGVLGPSSAVLELGCGVSALVGLAVGPLVGRYVLSDQSYVARLVEQNLAQNRRRVVTKASSSSSSSSRKAKASSAKGGGGGTKSNNNSGGGGVGGNNNNNITFHPLDWELDRPDRSLASDVVIACDCIYNEALIPPLVQTCVDMCRLRLPSSSSPSQAYDDGNGDYDDDEKKKQQKRGAPCVCVVAQQLRDPEVFESWLRAFVAAGFRAWRLPDDELPDGLKSSAGFVVHVGILREAVGSAGGGRGVLRG